jgi:hypothetical protein
LEVKARGGGAKLSPGFANEKKVDHFSLIVEVIPFFRLDQTLRGI